LRNKKLVIGSLHHIIHREMTKWKALIRSLRELDSNIFEENQRPINMGSFLFFKGNGEDVTLKTSMKL